MSLKKYNCPLCQWNSNIFYNEQFQKCSQCESIFRCPEFFISSSEEKARYQEHNNDVQNAWYQKFVSPLVANVLQNHTSTEKWLDFWAGTGPVISHLLWKQWFKVHLYDPFFHNKPNVLEKEYDFIIACEVIEHFHNPKKEFQLLYKLLKPGGKLYIMTDMYSQDIDFHNWYYKNDKTHVFFYTHWAFQYIKNDFKWFQYERQKRCIILEK